MTLEGLVAWLIFNGLILAVILGVGAAAVICWRDHFGSDPYDPKDWR